MKSVPCPLMPKEAYAHLSEHDRLCHVPDAKRLFEQEHPNIACSEGGYCHVCRDRNASIGLELQLQEFVPGQHRDNTHFQI